MSFPAIYGFVCILVFGQWIACEASTNGTCVPGRSALCSNGSLPVDCPSTCVNNPCLKGVTCLSNHTCTAHPIYCGKKAICHYQAICRPNECFMQPDAGLCRAYIERYFYNSDEKRCQIFIYGGCGGNGNNFPRWRECVSKCGRLQQGAT